MGGGAECCHVCERDGDCCHDEEEKEKECCKACKDLTIKMMVWEDIFGAKWLAEGTGDLEAELAGVRQQIQVLEKAVIIQQEIPEIPQIPEIQTREEKKPIVQIERIFLAG